MPGPAVVPGCLCAQALALLTACSCLASISSLLFALCPRRASEHAATLADGTRTVKSVHQLIIILLQVAGQYLEFLVSQERYEEAAALMPRLLKVLHDSQTVLLACAQCTTLYAAVQTHIH